MSTPTEISNDLAMFIAQTWRAAHDIRIGFDSICRIWAYDFGWLDINKSIEVRDRLIQAGWLKVDGEYILPAFSLDDIDIPFSWMPSMRILENPPTLSVGHDVKTDESVVDIQNDETNEGSGNEIHLDPATTHIKPLLQQISHLSKLEVKEILRRAQRKRRALGAVTLWMALLLVAREQRLSMSTLIETIS